MIFFDIDDTLLDNLGAQASASLKFYHEHTELHRLMPVSQFLRKWADSAKKYLRLYADNKISFQQQRRERVREIFQRTLTDVQADGLFAGYMSYYENAWSLFHDVIFCLDNLGPRRAGIISNGNRHQQRHKLTATGIMDRFDVIVISADIGVAKPHPDIFLHACELATEPPENCLYVGDCPETDAEGAQGVGLKGIWLNRRRLPADDGYVEEIQSLYQLSSVMGARYCAPMG